MYTTLVMRVILTVNNLETKKLDHSDEQEFLDLGQREN